MEKSQNRIYPNIYLGTWEADLLEVTKAGYLYEYEVKISRHDFRNDSRKAKYFRGTATPVGRKYDNLLAGKRVNYFSYIVPEGLVDPEEVPEWAGLIYARGYTKRICIGFDKDGGSIFEDRPAISLSTVKQPRKLRTEKITEREIEEIQKKLYFRYHKIRNRLIGQKLVTPYGIT